MSDSESTYELDLERFQSYFQNYMLDEGFRAETFRLSACTRSRAKELAALGFYSVKCKTTTVLNFKIACAFCDFSYESKPFDRQRIVFLDFEDCEKAHKHQHGTCPMVSGSGNFVNGAN